MPKKRHRCGKEGHLIKEGPGTSAAGAQRGGEERGAPACTAAGGAGAQRGGEERGAPACAAAGGAGAQRGGEEPQPAQQQEAQEHREEERREEPQPAQQQELELEPHRAGAQRGGEERGAPACAAGAGAGAAPRAGAQRGGERSPSLRSSRRRRSTVLMLEYKLVAQVLADRLRQVKPDVVAVDQTCGGSRSHHALEPAAHQGTASPGPSRESCP